jgi:hypothetical protein
MSNEADGRDPVSLSWAFLFLLLGLAVCLLLLPRSAASAVETVTFLERLAGRAEKASVLPPETRQAISMLLKDHVRSDLIFKDHPVLDMRRKAAISRIEAVVQKAMIVNATAQ